MNEWLSGWKARGWKTSSKKPVENKELWQEIDVLSAKHAVTWCHVKGHSGIKGNVIADELANKGAGGDRGSVTL